MPFNNSKKIKKHTLSKRQISEGAKSKTTNSKILHTLIHSDSAKKMNSKKFYKLPKDPSLILLKLALMRNMKTGHNKEVTSSVERENSIKLHIDNKSNYNECVNNAKRNNEYFTKKGIEEIIKKNKAKNNDSFNDKKLIKSNTIKTSLHNYLKQAGTNKHPTIHLKSNIRVSLKNTSLQKNPEYFSTKNLHNTIKVTKDNSKGKIKLLKRINISGLHESNSIGENNKFK